MTVAADETVADRIEAAARQIMARRAGLPTTWQYRAERRDLDVQLEVLLDQWLDITDWQ